MVFKATVWIKAYSCYAYIHTLQEPLNKIIVFIILMLLDLPLMIAKYLQRTFNKLQLLFIRFRLR